MKRVKKKLGYVPEKDNIIFARLMDAGNVTNNKTSKQNAKHQVKNA